MILRDRDTTGDGTLDERVYYLQNWRADVVALISDAGHQLEQVRYEPYGTPFGLPAGDINADGQVTQADANQAGVWYLTPAYDVRADIDMDGDLDVADLTAIATARDNTDALARGGLSLHHNRKGYAGYEHLPELAGAKWDVRNRILLSELGSWNRRDPLGYVDGVNLYEYVSSMTVIHFDPLGQKRSCWLCAIHFGAALASALGCLAGISACISTGGAACIPAILACCATIGFFINMIDDCFHCAFTRTIIPDWLYLSLEGLAVLCSAGSNLTPLAPFIKSPPLASKIA